MSTQTQTEPRRQPSRRAELPVLTVTMQEAGHITGLSQTTLYQMLSDGLLRSAKIGARRLIFVDSLHKALSDAAA